MITQVQAQGFKGLTFSQEMGRLSLFTGLNGTGKSARTQALTLALLGYIPGNGKKNEDILNDFGVGDKLVVGFRLDKDLFERGFVRTEKGVSQGFKYNGKKVAKDIFIHYLSKSGGPQAIDINAFMELSDQKKIDLIFDMYPPESDISQIVADIEKAKERVNSLEQKAKASKDAAARLAVSRSAMQLPVGSLAELQGQEKALTEQLTKAREDLEQARIDEAKAKAVEDERLRAEAQAKEDQAKKDKDPEPVKAAPIESAQVPVKTEVPQAAPIQEKVAPAAQEFIVPEFVLVDAAQSIQLILDALDSAGCSACAAKLIARRELKKFRRVAA